MNNILQGTLREETAVCHQGSHTEIEKEANHIWRLLSSHLISDRNAPTP